MGDTPRRYRLLPSPRRAACHPCHRGSRELHCERGDYSKNVQWRRMPGHWAAHKVMGGGHPWKCMESDCDPKSASRRCHRIFRLADCAWITASRSNPKVRFADERGGGSWKIFLDQGRSNPHEFVQLRRCHTPVQETELSFVSNFVCSVHKSSHCRAIQRGRKADAPDSGPCQFTHGE